MLLKVKNKPARKELPYEWGQLVEYVGECHNYRKYTGTILGYQLRDDGGYRYRVRLWRQNQHWFDEEDVRVVSESELCRHCKRPLLEDECDYTRRCC